MQVYYKPEDPVIYSTVNDENLNVSRLDKHWCDEVSDIVIYAVYYTIPFSAGSHQGHNLLQYYW